MSYNFCVGQSISKRILGDDQVVAQQKVMEITVKAWIFDSS
jgi:hypothetical protein